MGADEDIVFLEDCVPLPYGAFAIAFGKCLLKRSTQARDVSIVTIVELAVRIGDAQRRIVDIGLALFGQCDQLLIVRRQRRTYHAAQHDKKRDRKDREFAPWL